MIRISILLISLISMIGILALSINQKILQKIIFFLIAFAIGALFGDVFLHLMPQIYTDTQVHTKDLNSLDNDDDHNHLQENTTKDYNKEDELHEEKLEHQETGTVSSGHNHSQSTLPALLIVFGILFFFMIEKLLNRRHCHYLPEENKDHIHPVAFTNLIGDGLHNFMDGMLIAISYGISPVVGISSSIAVGLHELPQEIGDFATLVHAGFSRWKALLVNFLSATSAFLGAALILLVDFEPSTLRFYLLPITAGGFIYIAGSDLIPMLHQKNKLFSVLFQILGILLGVGVMVLLVYLE